MATTRKPKEQKSGENPPGKFHYNPVNMAGRKAGNAPNCDEPEAEGDTAPNGSGPGRRGTDRDPLK